MIHAILIGAVILAFLWAMLVTLRMLRKRG